ncbi:hypothetical protein GCM10011371_21920 [Novosphingobium marinum]|uniref:Uncharacterized protein n=1 Tax=Novosphingobium marinum TaxID=1514948 RepID=A0A7Z0BTR7_9SPHN|nr:hypothetical protein [Novosphingobium marinum]NYH96306.1 hypothetical protein [Novosphingobium marinum]GGC34213.1 hypothetical protein GCM10011371_21920 [Novosphingobium marinum]
MKHSANDTYKDELVAEIESLIRSGQHEFAAGTTPPLSDGRQWTVMPTDRFYGAIEKQSKIGARHLVEIVVGSLESIDWDGGASESIQDRFSRLGKELATRISKTTADPAASRGSRTPPENALILGDR